jgi:hypothetical protein
VENLFLPLCRLDASDGLVHLDGQLVRRQVRQCRDVEGLDAELADGLARAGGDRERNLEGAVHASTAVTSVLSSDLLPADIGDGELATGVEIVGDGLAQGRKDGRRERARLLWARLAAEELLEAGHARLRLES